MTKIAVIGAGLSGLMVAHFLKDYADITLFEKARGVGGRMSTRRTKSYVFDHGAQYFTARTQSFQDFIKPLLEQGIIERWNARYVNFKGNQIIRRKQWSEEEPRYVSVPGMNCMPKFLATNLHVHINTKIIALNYQSAWQLTDENNREYDGFDWVICTAPSPQATALLPNYFKYQNDIKDIEMRACFALMLGFKKNFPIKFEAAHVTHSDVSWIAVNSYKPKRPNPLTLIVHSSETYAENHIDDHHEQVMEHLMIETSHIIGHDVGIADYKIIHKWRYANNTKKDQTKTIFIDEQHKLAACGDWCLGGRIEGAFTSAYNLAIQMKRSIL